MLYDTLATDIRRYVQSVPHLECFACPSPSFLADLDEYVRCYGVDAIRATAEAIQHAPTAAHVVATICLWFGRLNHPASYVLRLHLLEINLWHESPWVRHGAVLGLTHMADPHARPYLRAALAREPIRVVRDDMQQVLDRLTQPPIRERTVGTSLEALME